MVWEGSIEASGQVVKKTESQHLMHCRLLAKPATWPSNLEQGWGKSLVSSLISHVVFLTCSGVLHGIALLSGSIRRLSLCSLKGVHFCSFSTPF